MWILDSPSELLQVMHECPTHFTFYVLLWVFPGIPSSYWSNDDVILLPPKAPPLLDESSNQQHSHLDPFLRMCYIIQ